MKERELLIRSVVNLILAVLGRVYRMCKSRVVDSERYYGVVLRGVVEVGR
jgi:hypothetical protein